MLREIMESKGDEKYLNELRDILDGQQRTNARSTKEGTKIVIYVKESGSKGNSLVISSFRGKWTLTHYESVNRQAPSEKGSYDLGSDLEKITPELIQNVINSNSEFALFRNFKQ